MYFKKFQIESTITWRNAAVCFIYEIIQNFKNFHGSSCYKYTNKQICKFVKQFHYSYEKYQDISAIRPGICNCNIMKKYPGFMHFFINFMKILQKNLTKSFMKQKIFSSF